MASTRVDEFLQNFNKSLEEPYALQKMNGGNVDLYSGSDDDSLGNAEEDASTQGRDSQQIVKEGSGDGNSSVSIEDADTDVEGAAISEDDSPAYGYEPVAGDDINIKYMRHIYSSILELTDETIVNIDNIEVLFVID